MGFPVCYSALPIPRLLLHMLLLLGFIRRFAFRALDAVGLGDLVDSDVPCPDHHAGGFGMNHHHLEFRSVSAMLVDEFLPVVRYEDLVGGSGPGCHVAGECAVCLYDFKGDEEVRRLGNCRHVFHRCCLDRWMEHDQRTCPLCRAPLLPEEMQDGAFDDRVWAAAGIPDSYSGVEDEYSPSFHSASSSPDQFVTQPLFFT